MSYMDELNFWLNDDYFDQKTKEELLAIRNNEAEVEDRFYKELEFGTGGLRGVIGADLPSPIPVLRSCPPDPHIFHALSRRLPYN